MKIVVIGGTGLIGTKVCKNLRNLGHQVTTASPSTGVNTLTGEGLKDALAGADVVVDVSNSPSFEDAAVLDFFQTSGRNLHAAEAAAGVKHHVALSIVGTDRNEEIGYFRAKVAQEKLIKQSGIPYTILRATQFFEFMGAIAATCAQGKTVRLPSAAWQPIASQDVADELTKLAVEVPRNQTVEISGPDRRPLAEFVKSFLTYNHDPREVVSDNSARYFGGLLDDRSLNPGANPIVGPTHFDSWLKGTAPQA